MRDHRTSILQALLSQAAEQDTELLGAAWKALSSLTSKDRIYPKMQPSIFHVSFLLAHKRICACVCKIFRFSEQTANAIAKDEAASFMRPAREVLLVVADRHRRSVERNAKRAMGSGVKMDLDESAMTLPALSQPKSLAPLIPLFHAGVMSQSAELREVIFPT